MEFEAELHARAGGEKCLANECDGAIETGSGRNRAAVGDIEFLEDGEAAGTEMALKFAKSVDGIGIVHEDEAANDGIEGFVEQHFGGIAFEEADVAHAAELRAGNGPLNGGGDAVGANDFTAGADEIGDEESDIASATADVENAHAGDDASLEKKLASERFVGLRLTGESMEFLLGLAGRVGGALCSGGAHGSLREMSCHGPGKGMIVTGRESEGKRRRIGYAAGKEEGMKFAKVVFWVAGIWGLLVITPLYFLFDVIGRQDPPAITHPGFYYGFVGVALAWQIAFLVIARDPVRFRLMMIPSMVEKFSWAIAVGVLVMQGRMRGSDMVFGGTDFLLGVLFVVAYLKTPKQ